MNINKYMLYKIKTTTTKQKIINMEEVCKREIQDKTRLANKDIKYYYNVWLVYNVKYIIENVKKKRSIGKFIPPEFLPDSI